MKKYFKQLNKFLDVVIWALIMLLYAAYMCIFLNISLLLSYLTKWINCIINGSMQFFRRSYKLLQKEMDK